MSQERTALFVVRRRSSVPKKCCDTIAIAAQTVNRPALAVSAARSCRFQLR